MSEQPFGQESVPPQQDSTPHYAGQSNPQLSENVYDQHKEAIASSDDMHRVMLEQQRVIAEMQAQLDKYAAPVQDDVEPVIAGGAPVAHHLKLVDGRTVVGHGGVSTHFSEVLDDGTSKVTRVEAYYPADEPDPSTLYL